LSVFDELVGQDRAVAELQAAAGAAAEALEGGPGAGMTHAWLFTGPPGSGRSVAARAFAAALQCPQLGCGHCEACHTVLAGTHADVTVVRPAGLSLGIKDVRSLVLASTLAPAGNRWQVIIMEDADRLTEEAANALLKAIEEPARRTVWLLCTPAPDDLVVTIRSRCRLVTLRTPSAAAVTSMLVQRDGIDEAMAAFAARASQGHVGRARRLATDEASRRQRQEVLRLPTMVGDVGSCLVAAANLVDAATEEADSITAAVDDAETAALKQAYGEGATGGAAARSSGRAAAAVLKDLQRKQKSRATRTKRDALDRALVDLASFYRDVLVVQLRAGVELANGEQAPAITKVATSSTPEATLRRIDAVLECRELLAANANPLLAVEAMTLALRAG
jgi:DNA polymerase-3 subunit delta'